MKTTIRTLLGTALALTLTTTAGAWTPPNLTPEATEALTAPLSPDDPHAVLDPALVGVPEATAPAPKDSRFGRTLHRRNPGRALVHDLETGTTRRLAPSTERRSLERLEGFGGTIQVEPGTADQLSIPGLNRNIFGTDDRLRVINSAAHPYRMVTKLYTTYSNGRRTMCSGVMIGPNDVVTAAHCVINPSYGRATRIEVIPGLGGTFKPYGSAFGVAWTWPSAYRSGPDHDMLVLNLDRRIGDRVGWMGLSTLSDGSLRGAGVNTAGYPGDRYNGTAMYRQFGPILGVSPYALQFRLDVFGGQSGSPLYTYDGKNGRYVVGLITHSSSSYNYGPRLNSVRYRMVADARNAR